MTARRVPLDDRRVGVAWLALAAAPARAGAVHVLPPIVLCSHVAVPVDRDPRRVALPRR